MVLRLAVKARLVVLDQYPCPLCERALVFATAYSRLGGEKESAVAGGETRGSDASHHVPRESSGSTPTEVCK